MGNVIQSYIDFQMSQEGNVEVLSNRWEIGYKPDYTDHGRPSVLEGFPAIKLVCTDCRPAEDRHYFHARPVSAPLFEFLLYHRSILILVDADLCIRAC